MSGTLANVSCEEGFIFPDGNRTIEVQCVSVVTSDGRATTAYWSIPRLECEGKSKSSTLALKYHLMHCIYHIQVDVQFDIYPFLTY